MMRKHARLLLVLSLIVTSSATAASFRDLHHIEQTKIIQYKLWEPHEISETVLKWAEHYPDYIRVYTSQDRYGLPTAGNTDDCPHDDGPGCLNYILEITDYTKHPEGSATSKALPEVLWSGELHGNEQVGPTAVLEATQLLLDSVSCEALPNLHLKQEDPDAFHLQVTRAQSCRDELEAAGIDDNVRKWLSRLVSTRRLIVVPTANALGYYQKVREENRIDPNRDFPYDTSPTECMQTIAGRTLNEIFREHYFQLSLTFHGGMEVIGYEWGAPSYQNQISPDDVAQSQIANAYSRFAGGWTSTQAYAYGPMNDLVYPVHGGMEDWAYAASFDPNLVPQCTPQTYGGYPKEKTIYDDSTLRVFNMLVETSNSKIPQSELGTSLGLFDDPTKGNGHIARNIRLALLALELVEPYLDIITINELDLVDNIIPGTISDCRRVSIPHNSRKTVLRWSVGGAITVDNTKLLYAKYEDVRSSMSCDGRQPMIRSDDWRTATMIGDDSGHTQFSKTPSPPFSASIDISGMGGPTDLVVMAVAMVDQEWKTSKTNMAPQSHVVNARTNPDWHHENDKHVILGRLEWYSQPVIVSLVETDDVETVEVSKRFDRSEDSSAATPSNPQDASESRHGDKPGSSPMKSPDVVKGPEEQSKSSMLMVILILGVSGTVLFIGGRSYLNYAVRTTRRERLHEYIEDNDAVFSSKTPHKNSYHDVKEDDELELGEFS